MIQCISHAGIYRTLPVLLLFVCLALVSHIQLDFSSEEVCACNQCVAEVEEDPWFRERYNSLVPTMLSRQNSKLSPDTAKWWKKLQAGSEKENFTTVVDILLSLFPDEEHYSDAGPHRCRTCAVVGNSGNLIGSHYGPLIDAHDFVIRMNRGPTVGFEEDVGSRTTHRAIYPESAMDMDNSTHLILVPFKIADLRWLISVFTTQHIKRTYTAVKSTIKADMDKVMVLHPEFMKYVYDSWLQKQGSYPSTGFFMTVLSLHICDQVNLFGFGANNNGDWHHYFSKSYKHNLNKGKHRGSVEYNITMALQEKKKLQMYKGW